MPTMTEMYRKTQNGMTKSLNHGLNIERATPTRDTRTSELLNHSRSNLIQTLYCGLSAMGNLLFRAVRAAMRNSKHSEAPLRRRCLRSKHLRQLKNWMLPADYTERKFLQFTRQPWRRCPARLRYPSAQVAPHHQLQDPSASSVIRTVAGVPGGAVASSSDLSGTRALARK